LLGIAAAGSYLYFQRRERVPAGVVKSLVVLPFINASANPDTEYLSDGIAESLIDNLSQIPGLQVLARNTAFRYRGKDVDLQKLARELSVDAVLTGRVQERSGTLVVHADLVNLGTGSQLWGEKYNRPLTDLLAVEVEIARAISDKLRPRLTPELQHRVTKRYTDNPEAYQLYLRGRYFWNKRTKEDLNRGIAYFERAIEMDPNYALAYSGLADSYNSIGFHALAGWNESYARAEAAALKALALDDELAEAHTSLGGLKLQRWDWPVAEKELKRAIALNPNYAVAHNRYGSYLTMNAQNDRAIAEYARAQQLDPSSSTYTANVGMLLCQMGQFDRGVAQFRDALQLNPDDAFSYLMLADGCYVPRKMYPEAIDALSKAIALNPNDPRFSASLAYAYAQSGNKERALSILKELRAQEESRKPVAVTIAQVYIGLDDKDRAFEWLEKAYQQRSIDLNCLKSLPWYAPLRSDPRYADLVRRVGFPP
jgi:TolB-like protein/Tfp pilus assembly protein PilF